MLPSGAIQKRRQTHRRQQSLEVPILAHPLPPNPRRNHQGPYRPGHRRGLSLDQAMHSQSGFRPLQAQEITHGLPSGPLSARPQTDTNLAYPLDQQHLKQETQEHSLAQPGFIAHPPPPAHTPDFQSHLHRQLNGAFNPSASPANPSPQAAAMQELQNHMMWYQHNFGNGSSPNPNPNIQNQPMVQLSHPVAGDMAAPAVFMSQAPMAAMPATPIPHGHSQTVPNTPQNHNQNWPSPPPSHIKHQRSQSYQLDVAPMPPNHDGIHFQAQNAMINNGSFNMAGDQDYAASAYSSSVADASSPPHQHSTPMPTLFEEPTPHYPGRHADLLFQAAAGAEPDFNDPHFMVGGGSLCPEQAALDAAGIDATYIDTGITEDQINSWLEHSGGKGDAYRCKWEGCGTKINRKENARSHVQNHLDDRRFRCNPCGKRFNRLHDTKRHHLTHTNERPAICPCGKTFARADALTRHRQRDMCEGVLPGYEKAEDEKPKRGRPKKDRSEGGDKSKKHRPDMETRTKKAALARAMDQANAGSQGISNSSMSSPASDRSMPDTPPQDSDELDATDFLGINGANNQFNNASSSWLDTPPTSPPSATPTKIANSKIFIDLSIPEEQPESVSPSKLSTRSSPGPNACTAASSLPNSSSPVAEAQSHENFFSYSNNGGFAGESSPVDAGVDIFNDTLNFDVMDSHPEVGREVFSPPGESCSGSSVYNSDWDTVHVGTAKTTLNLPTAALYSESFGEVSRNALSWDDFIGTVGEMPEEDSYTQVRDILDSWVTSH